jgi:hypothetical protein
MRIMVHTKNNSMNNHLNRNLRLILTLTSVLLANASANASMVTLPGSGQSLIASTAPGTSSVTYNPNPADLNDLDHHDLYTWRIDNIAVNPANITSATLTISNIANWDTSPNVLHMHLLDTAINPGVASFVDDPTNSTPVEDMTDDFKNARFHNSRGWLVAAGTADTFLKDASFTTTATTFTYTFSGASLAALQQYIANGHDIAFGLDPDCHFYNDGVSFTIDSVTPVPEITSILPLCGLVASAVGLEIRRRRRTNNAA